ncbi:hypothetical protein Q3G72_023524 [Acer saccharum]|nr:hypothetical protein Q3G72_023524 [Acer saccharum]
MTPVRVPVRNRRFWFRFRTNGSDSCFAPCPLTPPTAATVLSSSSTPRLRLGRFSLVDDAAWSDRSSPSTLQPVFDFQEALLNLGFYFGEEDMDFSSFSTGTEHAVKTWQVNCKFYYSHRYREDGIMKAELLERLYMKQQFEDGGTNLSADQEATTMFPQGGMNGAAVASVTEITEMQQLRRGAFMREKISSYVLVKFSAVTAREDFQIKASLNYYA